MLVHQILQEVESGYIIDLYTPYGVYIIYGYILDINPAQKMQ